MTDAEEIAILKDQIVALSKENKELKEMFEIVCKERYGYAWEMRKSDLVEKLKRRIIK